MHWRSPFIIPVEDVDFVPGTDNPSAAPTKEMLQSEKAMLEAELKAIEEQLAEK